jgi:asparagine synthase (glutamine-hydrolysing)
MSQIAGVVRLDGAAVELNTTDPLLAAMTHPYMDALRSWHDGQVALYHTALHTLPESAHCQQPCTIAEDNRYWISADARLDYRDELQHVLAAHGQAVTPQASDAELILHAYSLWGRRCIEHLAGDFAFAIWDKAQRTLFCGRDHFGVRPLHYFQAGDVFIFASDVATIRAHPQAANLPLNKSRIADYLVMAMDGLDAVSTFFEHIQRLPPAHTLVVEDGRVTVQRYWTLTAPEPVRFRRDDDYAEAFGELFTRAVQSRLSCNSPQQVAASLSGGLDSSSVAAVAREHYRQRGYTPLQTLSVVAPTTHHDDRETHFIDVVIASGGLDAVRVPADVDTIRAYAPLLDKLLHDSTDLYDHWLEVPQLLCIAAQQRNIKVILTGLGGDEFADLPDSYPTYLLRGGQLQRAWQEIVGYHAFHAHHASRPLQRLRHHLYHAFVPAPLRKLRTARLERRSFQALLSRYIINSDFARQVDLFARWRQLREAINTDYCADIRGEQLHFLQNPYIGAGLQGYWRVALCYGIELRHPYFDLRLIQFLLAVPPDQLVHEGWTKNLVRRSMKGMLTDEVRFRRGVQHIGWRVRAIRFLAERGRFTPMMTEWLDVLSPFVDIAKLRTTFDFYLANLHNLGGQDRGIEHNLQPLWYALTLAFLLKKTILE